MSKHEHAWKKIRRKKIASLPFKKDYCECGKRSFKSIGEAERYRKAEIDGTKKRAHVYKCPESFDYHITYKKG